MTEQIYTPGKIVVFSWGYDQTNIDYYLITQRKGDFATLQPIGEKTSYNEKHMIGESVPDESKKTGKPFRRKVHTSRGEEIGIAIKSFGWASLWDGRPKRYSTYG